eukprot:TRINITY_DN16832_c0_g1_i1.p1 TRINITY_DN16832_c0_g1~~TRINITY_DN16832_c0_g1_i1.p1  ORF type:complete len:980 (+),score=266.13 TRINITY_DN16832_c0_g1_i1:76-3015(+)
MALGMRGGLAALCMSTLVFVAECGELPAGITSVTVPGEIDDNFFEWIDESTALFLDQMQVRYTKNAGRTWAVLQVPCLGIGSACVRAFAVHPRGKYAFMDLVSGNATTTVRVDFSKSPPAVDHCTDEHNMVLHLDDVKAHPRKAAWLLGLHEPPCPYSYAAGCPSNIYFSQDYGRTYKRVKPHDPADVALTQTGGWTVDWSNYEALGPEHDDKEIMLIRKHVLNDVSLGGGFREVSAGLYRWNIDKGPVDTSGSGRSQLWHPFVVDAEYFVHIGKYTFAAVLDSYTRGVQLWVLSDDSPKFQHVRFPSDNGEESYTILDDSEGTVFANVYHKACARGQVNHWGHVYSSDKAGVHFTMALPYNRRNSGSLGGDAGACDFHKIRGLAGVFVANRLTKQSSLSEACLECSDDSSCWKHCEYETVMNWEKGSQAYWEPLKVSDQLCSNTESGHNCHLHLHGVASHQEWISGLVSKWDSPGVIMASGNVGQKLDIDGNDIGVFFSDDAGISWKRVASGAHAYDWLNFGGFIVMAEVKAPTRFLKVSDDMGQSFHSVQFVADNAPAVLVKRLRLQGGRSHAGQQTTVVVIETTTESGTILFHLDVRLGSRPLSGPPCGPLPKTVGEVTADNFHDYQVYTPRPGEMFDADTSECFLGSKTDFVRKRPGSKCWTEGEVGFLKEEKPCPCTAQDYICDEGFILHYHNCVSRFHQQAQFWSMIEAKWLLETPEPADCNGHWIRTKGYRRIPGDLCNVQHPDQEPGLNLDGERVKCKGNGIFSKGSSSGLIIFLLLLLVVAAAAGTWYGYDRSPTCAAIVDIIRDALCGVCAGAAEAARNGVDAARNRYGRVPQMGDFDLEGASDHEEIVSDRHRAESPPWRGIPNGEESAAAARAQPPPAADPAPAPAAPAAEAQPASTVPDGAPTPVLALAPPAPADPIARPVTQPALEAGAGGFTDVPEFAAAPAPAAPAPAAAPAAPLAVPDDLFS